MDFPLGWRMTVELLACLSDMSLIQIMYDYQCWLGRFRDSERADIICLISHVCVFWSFTLQPLWRNLFSLPSPTLASLIQAQPRGDAYKLFSCVFRPEELAFLHAVPKALAEIRLYCSWVIGD